MVMSKKFYRISNNKSGDNIEKKNLFIVSAPLDVLLGIQSKIKNFIFK